MGWARTLLLGDIGNRLDIADTEEDIRRLKSQLQHHHHENLSQDELIRRLAGENDQLKLYLASLVRLLVARGHITAGELEAMVSAVDAEDGAADGRFEGDLSP